MKFSKEHKEKLKESYKNRIARGDVFGFQKGHPKYLVKHTEESKKKMSIIQSGRKLSKEHKKKLSIAHKGKMPTEEAKLKNRLSHLGVKKSMETRKKMSEYRINHPNKVFRDTSIELAIQDELANRKILFIKQYSIPSVAIVDFYLPEFNIAIQCDGCYWHNCLEHYPNNRIEQRGKDVTQNAKMLARGIKVFRFWEHDIKISPKDCVDSLLI